MAHSIEASSIGIGRMQASYFSDASYHEDEIEAPGFASSAYSHSIMASSANLADPFAEEDMQSPQSTSPPSKRYSQPTSAISGAQQFDGSTSAYSAQQSPTQAQTPSAHQRLFSSQSSRSPAAGLVDSVSSLATTATDATTKAPPKILHGREVAELALLR